MEQMLEITGTVEAIVYRNESNGYTVLELAGDEEITAVGIMPSVSPGEEVKLIGSYKKHPSYGEQFAVTACEQSMPKNTAGILKYLSSRAIKGIGPSMAQRLVKQFGEDTLTVMENEPERVAQVKGISLDKAKEISEQLKQTVGIRELIAHLSGFGVTPLSCIKVWQRYGSNALKYIEENPFLLCDEEFEIPFETVDLIAKKQNRANDEIYRIRAGISHVLSHNRLNGHTCLPKDKLISTTASFLSVEKEKAVQALDEMVFDNTVITADVGGNEFIFTPSLYQCEAYIAARIKMLLRFSPPVIPRVDEQIEHIEQQEGLEYASLQREAIKQAMTTGLLILTGGPGTGKTTTLNAIITILKQNGQKVLLAAPTGRAAQRMSEVTGCEAKTIHRLLEVGWDRDDKPVFKKNEKNLLNCDALIIDEVSMVDTVIFDSLMKAMPLGCRLILVGDSNQLPSVGAGNVLADLIASGIMPVVALNEIFRQSMESLIVTNAHKIVNGEYPVLDRRDKDFFYLSQVTAETVAQTVTDLTSRRLPNSYGYSPFDDIQVLCPGRKGMLGANELNKKLQLAVNPKSDSKPEITVGATAFRLGDKVMQVKNNYDITFYKDNGEIGQGIFNGDIGRLVEINKATKIMKVRFDDKVAVYDADSAVELDLAYATTVHKSQGNEFEAVIIPVFRMAPQLCYRNLLYTAVTRAKKLLILVGTGSTVVDMVDNNRKTLRYSGLKDFLLKD
ncbi:MAG: ATP-dependent RecD-like DNA helicase [Acutalibacteraceae bacterium]